MLFLKVAIVVVLILGANNSFEWILVIQLMLIFTAVISYRVRPFVLDNDNFMQLVVFLSLVAMMVRIHFSV